MGVLLFGVRALKPKKDLLVLRGVAATAGCGIWETSSFCAASSSFAVGFFFDSGSVNSLALVASILWPGSGNSATEGSWRWITVPVDSLVEVEDVDSVLGDGERCKQTGQPLEMQIAKEAP